HLRSRHPSRSKYVIGARAPCRPRARAGYARRESIALPPRIAVEELFLRQLARDALDVVIHLVELAVGQRLAGRDALLAVLVLDRSRERMERARLQAAFELDDRFLEIRRHSRVERCKLDHPFLVAAPGAGR